MPQPGSRSEPVTYPIARGWVTSLDVRQGVGSIRGTDGISRGFNICDILDNDERRKVIDHTRRSEQVLVDFMLVVDRVCNIVLVQQGEPQTTVSSTFGACDNPALREDPPMFAMRVGPVEGLEGPPSEIPVVLVDSADNLMLAMREIVSETKAVGIDVTNSLTESKKPVLVVCVASAVFVVELCLLDEKPSLSFAAFLYGLPFLQTKVPFASVERDPFLKLQLAYPSLFNMPFACENVLPSSQTLEDLIDALFAYRMEPVTSLGDKFSYGCHLGRRAFHARQIFCHQPTPNRPSHPNRPIYPQPVSHPVHASYTLPVSHAVQPPASSSMYHTLAPVRTPLNGRVRTHPLAWAPAAVPARRMPPVEDLVPPASPISVTADLPDILDMPEVPDTTSVMTELLDRVKASKRKAGENEENAKKFLQWFENQ